MRDNRITELPSDLGKLGQLTYFNVQGNKLTTIPKSLGRFFNLEYTRIMQKDGKCLLAGNPLAKVVTTQLKKGGFPALFQAMKEPDWSQSLLQE